MSGKLVLVSHHLCPYVQRAVIALSEKGVPFERVYVDLADKPDWFLRLSPLGKVPLLRIGDRIIFESNVILEYLEETQPNPLHPADPLDRAEHRAWIEFGSAVLNGIARFYNAPDAALFETERTQLATRFARIEERLDGGPWFNRAFGLVDAVYGPIFRYFDTFDLIADFGILSGKPKAEAWRDELTRRPSVQEAVAADYPDRLFTFLQRRKSHLSSLMERQTSGGIAA
jgi:glutathione S-transferase